MATAVLPACPFSTCVTPGVSRNTHPEGEPCIINTTVSYQILPLLLSHCQLLDTMQSVVTGHRTAPITLERKITPGDKTKTEGNTHNNGNKYISQTKIKRWDQLTYVPRYISYVKRVAAEAETEEKTYYPQEKDRMKQTMSKSKSKKGRKRSKSQINQHQERKKEDSTQREYAYFRLARSARGV